MQKKKINYKSLTITLSLIVMLLLVFYGFIGILISGPVFKKEAEEASVIEKIKLSNIGIDNIEKNVFNYITYTGEDQEYYYIFDENGKRISIREKKDAKLSEVKKLIKKDYPNLVDVPIKVTYGKDSPVYLIEKDYEVLALHFDELSVVFYMKEGE